jgi:hypothetical protein
LTNRPYTHFLGVDDADMHGPIETTDNVHASHHETSEGQSHIEPLPGYGESSTDELLDLSFLQALSGPRIKHLAHVFPPYLCNGIAQTNGSASVTMALDWTIESSHSMVLKILPTKNQYIAMELFAIHLEPCEGIWNIIQSNGGSHSFEQLTLQGAPLEGIQKVFGTQVVQGVESSPARQREASSATKCVKLQIASNPSDNATFEIYLGAEDFHQIKDVLFPNVRQYGHSA